MTTEKRGRGRPRSRMVSAAEMNYFTTLPVSEQVKNVMFLRYNNSQTYAQVAATLGLTINKVKYYLTLGHRAIDLKPDEVAA